MPDNSELPPSVIKNLSDGKYGGAAWRLSPIYHEGELIGFLFISASDRINEEILSGIAGIAFAGLNAIIKNIVKRVFTTELHTTVVQRSYEELLEINRNLAASEKNYKELSETLEQKVLERTEELKRAYTRLLQQEKMASIGQLAAGVAHEINNPIGFIYSNLNTLKKYIGNLNEIIRFYKVKGQELEVIGKDAEELYKKLKIEFIMSDINDLIKQSTDGAERIKNIVANLKGFSHIDEAADREISINTEMDNTISVLSHEIKARSAEIVKHYGKIAGFFGNPGLICQAFLNILLNALHSKDDNIIVTIKTEQHGNNAVISIADNGKGIPPDIQSRIFEPFFTTKDVGKGMGMGLTVAYDIISQYGGNIEVKSEMERGSTFVITLPLKRTGLME
ncbi:sensor histidine kinase [Dissulfurispira sp.]|uniref:sensor histidine kinase n=1 Tax=Dissulfurispira sp. TaxID=2817609 RepID=UPI002FDB722B